MSRIAKSTRPVSSSLIESVDGGRRDHVEADAGGAVVVARERGVDPGVDRVGREVEHQRRVCAQGLLGAFAGADELAARVDELPAEPQPAAAAARTQARAALAAIARSHQPGQDRRNVE